MSQRDSSERQANRRTFLKASGAGAVALSLAGCGGQGGEDTPTETPGGGGDTPTKTPTEEPTPTPTPTPTTPAAPGADVPKGGTFTYGMSAKPDSPSIFLSGSVYSAVALSPVHMYGVASDPVTYETKPWLYSDWKLTGKDSDTPVAHFKVREEALNNLQFGHGKDLTMEDIRFSYQYVLDQQPGELAGFIGAVKSISESTEDGMDFQLQMKKKVVTWETTAVAGVPIIPKDRWTTDAGKQVNYKEFNPMDEYGNEVGLGPGVLTQFKPDTAMQVKFDNPSLDAYRKILSGLEWRRNHEQIIAGGPFLDTINFRIFGSQSAMTQAFLNGDIDTHYGSMQASKVPKVKENKGQTLVQGFDSGFSYHGYNLRRPPLDDAALRQAMNMMWDHVYWIQRLQRNYSLKGDYPHSPGYRAARPEVVFEDAVDREVSLLEDPATELFDFRQTQPGVPDIQGIRKFLKNGKVITGEPGTYVGQEFPGTLSGVRASQSESKYDYTFGEVKTQLLKETQGVDKEIRVDGQTIPEMMDGDPIVMFIDPPQKKPREAKAIQDWVNNLRNVGIPIKTKVLSFNTMVSKVYRTEAYDIYPMGWGGTNPYGTSLYFFFHTDNADTSPDKPAPKSFVYNSTGYGLGENAYEEQLKQAYTTLDLEKASRMFAKANERIYLDAPYFVWDYAKMQWPIQSNEWAGYVGNVVDPAFASWGLQWNNLHKRES